MVRRREGCRSLSIDQMRFFSKLVDAFERKQCVCVAGTAGLSAPEVCEYALL